MSQLQSWRFVVIQGDIIQARRDYSTLFKWMSTSKYVKQTRSFHVILIGRVITDFRPFSFDIVRANAWMQERIVILPGVRHLQYSAVLDCARAVLPGQRAGDMTYVSSRSSGTVPTAISHAVPLLADFRVGAAYGLPVTRAVIEYRNPDIRALSQHVTPSSLETLRSFDTFEQAVSWVIALSPSEFETVRRQVMKVRDELFDYNTRLLADEIHHSQTAAWNI
eukprot:c27719_g1_i1.p1 GENE.c27719_g1_i1~~c27719_g1_i1.p1  ORF type:complete len:246 (-),score=63.08 c27719_g1_i1:16-681(-)